MNESKHQVEEALTLMQEARKILFQILHEGREVSRSLAEGVEKLSLAFEYAENPDGLVCLCPTCECLYFEKLTEKTFKCLSCDQVWNSQEEAGHEQL